MKKSKRYIKKQNKKNLINKKVLNKIINSSNICKHAIRELKLAGFDNEKDGPEKWIYDQIIEAVAVFASHHNSCFSAGIETNLVNKLCNYKIITPLTFKDDEWNEISINEYQNNRCSHIFKNNGRIYDINAYTKKVVRSKYFGKDEFEYNDNNCCWSGGFFFTKDDILTGEYVNIAYIPDYDIQNNKYVVRDSIELETTEIEIAKDDWFMTVNKTSVNALLLNVCYIIEPIIIESIKDIHIKNLTYEQANAAEEYVRNYKNK